MKAGRIGALLVLVWLAACGDEPWVVSDPSPATVPAPDAPSREVPGWVEAPAGLDARGDLVAVGFGFGPSGASATVSAADTRARLEVARALLPLVVTLLADLERRNPLAVPLREPAAPDPLPGIVAESALDAVQLGEVHAVPSRGVVYRRARLVSADLIAAYRAALLSELEAARAAGTLPDAGWAAVEQHLAGLPGWLAAEAAGGAR